MPDWITHLGMAYISARVARVREIQLVLLGAILPDVVVPIFVAIEIWDLPLSQNLFTYLAPFHSLTIVSLLAAAIALLSIHPGRCFLLLWAGSLTHFALDVLEADIDCGMRVLYPFSFHSLSIGWLATGSGLSITLLVISAIAVAFALKERARFVKLSFQLKYKNVCGALVLAGMAFVLPLMTQQMLMHHNVHFLAFLADPAGWQGRMVELCFSKVVSTSPIKITEFNKQFELITREDLDIGEYVSVRGVYRDGQIYPTDLYFHHGFSEGWRSLVGLTVLLALWWPAKLRPSY